MDASLHDAYANDYDQQVQDYGAYISDALFGLCFVYLQPGQRLLDIGIGTGLSAAPFAKTGLKVYGMDFSSAMLDVCRAKGFTAGLELHDLRIAPWPYSGESFDHLICCGTLHFLAELETIFSEANRVLRPKGIFAFTTKAPERVKKPAIRKFGQKNVGGFEIFAHQPAYLRPLMEDFQFRPLKKMRCFVGSDPFYLWVTQKIKE